MLYLILLLIGIAGGALAGLLGVGGGLIFTPVLIFLYAGSFENPVPWIIATSLLCTFAASLSSIRKHQLMKNLFLKESVMVGLCGLTGTLAGKAIVSSAFYSETEFIILFSLLLLYTGFRFLRAKPTAPELNNPETAEIPIIRFHHALLIGALGGLVATLAGVGGGIVMVPIMLMILKLPYLKTISISSAAIVFISFFGWAQFAIDTPAEPSLSGYAVGYVDFGSALPLIIGALAGAHGGVWLSTILSRKKAEIIFAMMALAVAARLIYGQFF
ncbi:MAG: sulfite exporter TauE/SafE family protein [Balneolia bacterium]|nr:sulfite exporter TauE/SafE family protein [Balneolia bacterium]